MRVGYFGPEGTFTHEAAMASVGMGVGAASAGAGGAEVAGGPAALELVPLPTIYDTVMAVHHGDVDRALVPIENSLEGSVNATLDALAMETEDVAIVGEVIHPIRHCLIARTDLELAEIETVISHPQATAQCARFIREHLRHARVLSGSSTAEAVRMVAEHDGPWAALGNRLAAEEYGCPVLRAGVEDVADNETRFVWLGPVGAPAGVPGRDGSEEVGRSGGVGSGSGGVGGSRGSGAVGSGSGELRGRWKTAIVFWGVGDDGPGWLVGCMTELAAAGINLTRIESRPRKRGLGHYMFFIDLEGRDTEPHVSGALEALRERVEVLRVLGSFPAG